MINNPFRQESAIARSERQRLDYLLRVTAPHENAILIATAVLLLGFIVWAFVGTIAHSITIDGFLIEQGNRHEVVILQPGHLLEVEVAPGDQVSEGDLIAQQTVPQLEREISLLRGRIDLLQTQLNEREQDDHLSAMLHTNQVLLSQLEAQHLAHSNIVSHSDGVVATVHKSVGEFMTVGSVVAEILEGESQVKAVALIPSNVAEQIQEGMQVTVEFVLSDSTHHQLVGEVVALNGRPADWIAMLPHKNLESINTVEVQIDQPSDLFRPYGMRCRIRVKLESSSLLDILNFGH